MTRTRPQAVELHHQYTGDTGEAALAHPRSTTPTKNAAKLVRGERKYYKANREAIYARRAKRAKRKQAAIKAGQKETSAET